MTRQYCPGSAAQPQKAACAPGRAAHSRGVKRGHFLGQLWEQPKQPVALLQRFTLLCQVTGGPDNALAHQQRREEFLAAVPVTAALQHTPTPALPLVDGLLQEPCFANTWFAQHQQQRRFLTGQVTCQERLFLPRPPYEGYQ